MKKKYYFIAIGGIGMSGLAKYLLECGCEVAGSDIYESKYTAELEKLGAKVFIGHNSDNLPEDCTVIASTAIREDNPEIVKAKALGLPIYHRSDLLAEISREGKFFIGYAGTHGKTTTSGFASYVLDRAGYEPSFIVGGFVPEINTNAHCTQGKHFIAELDESDGTIVKYSPNIAVINNIEEDHLDFFTEGLSAILKTFETFLSGLKEDAIIIANNDCANTVKLLEGRKHITFGLNNADYTAKNINYQEDFTTFDNKRVSLTESELSVSEREHCKSTGFDVYYKDEFLTHINIILKGVHNVYNALSVFASLHQAGCEIEKIKPHFATFTGMGRRFQKVVEFDNIVVYDDYAHHPTEIKAVLSSAVSFKDKNIVAVFQPHRFTRLQRLWDEFLDAFENADRVVVTDIYSASEDPIEGITSERFVEELSKKISVPIEHMSGNMNEFAQKLLPTLKPNDIVIGMGAGTITYLGKEISALI